MALTLNGTTGLSGIVGSAGTPALQGSDTNTGYFFGTDTLGLSTGGSERLRITSTGKVCINNDNASSDLHICTAGSGEQDGTLRLGGSASGLGLVFDYDQSGSTVARIFANDNYDSNTSALKICSDLDDNPNQLVLLGSGDIGIGRSDPGHKLAILGGASSQLEIKGTEADFWLTSTGGGSDKAWRILGSTGGTTHRFRIYDNANGKEPFYIIGSNGSNTQHVHVNSGNLVFDAAGTGIDFSAQTPTSATGAAPAAAPGEVLDHYEEGTWTPVLTSGFNYQTLSASYTRIGNVVNVFFNLYRNDAGTYSGDLDVTGLPFAIASSSVPFTNSMGLGLAASYNGSSDRRIGFINTNNASSVKVIKDGTTSYVSYDDFTPNTRALTMKWWYYTA